MSLHPPTPAAAGPVETADPLVAALERLQTASLDRLRATDVDRAVFVQLLEASCLLELAKLSSASLDPVSYLQACTDLLTQFFPVTGCRIVAEAPGQLEADVSCGVPVDADSAGARHRIVVRGAVVGELLVGTVTVRIAEVSLFRRAAEQVGAGLTSAMEHDSLRRNAAAATAARLAVSVDPEQIEGSLVRLTDALGAWPGVLACELHVDHALSGPPLVLRSGWWGEGGPERPVSAMEATSAGGPLAMRVRWQSAPDDRHVQALEAILDTLGASLDRVERERRLAAENESDPLTGVGNRRRLDRTMAVALARAERMGEELAVIVVDLDHFKRVNDALGHDVGDEVLIVAAHALRDTIRAYDEVCRAGGEEFVIVAPAIERVGTTSLVDRFRVAVAEACAPILPDGWRQTASFGAALHPANGRTKDELLKSADEALYQAKRTGRDRLVFADDCPPAAG